MSVYLSGLHQIKTRVFVGGWGLVYCVLHITVLCNVGVTEEVCTPSVITRLRLRSAHFTESRQERRDHDNQMTAQIFPKCAMRRKWVLGYVQEGKVLKVVLSIKFIWGRDILYPRPSKIDWASLHWKSIKGRGEERDWNNDHTSKNIKKTFLSYDNRILIPRGAKKITDIGCPGILMIPRLWGEPGCIHNIINDNIPRCSPQYCLPPDKINPRMCLGYLLNFTIFTARIHRDQFVFVFSETLN